MSRDYSVLLFDLSNGNPPRRDQLSCRHAFVADMPDAAVGVATIKIDGGDAIPIRRGDRFTACDGGAFSSIEIDAPATPGTVSILVSQESLVPLASGGARAANNRARILDVSWLPHHPLKTGDPLAVDGMAAGGVLWPILFTVEGNPAFMNTHGHRCGDLRPGGGTSGARSGISFPWQRKVIEPGVGGGTLLHQLDARAISYRVSCALFCLTTGAKSIGAGLQIAQGRGTLENLSGNNAGLGIVPDVNAGANAWWRFIARAVDAGPLTIDQPLPKPSAGATRNAWARFGIELVDANPITGQDGKVIVYAGGVPVLTFTDMNLLPPAYDGVDSTGFDVRVVDQGADADRVFFSHFHQAVDAETGGDE